MDLPGVGAVVIPLANGYRDGDGLTGRVAASIGVLPMAIAFAPGELNEPKRGEL